MPRPRTLIVAVVLLIFLCPIPQTKAAATSRPANVAIDPAVQKSIDAAVKYIVSKQKKDGPLCEGGDQEQTAITSLAIMALKSDGVQMSQQTPAAAAMRKAMTWILQDARLRPDGYFGVDGECMYTHGVTTLMLGQMAGAGVDPQQNVLIRKRLARAVDLILASQKTNHMGGWRYNPTSSDADVGVTAWQVRTLAAAQQAGISVPKQAFASAADFIKSCTANLGGFAYVPGGDARWSCSATGLLALQLCGQGKSPEAKLAVDYLQARPQPANRVWYLYACPAYVAALGATGPDDLATARDNVGQTVLQYQQPDGSFLGWEPDNQHGQVFCTSLVILGLTARPALIEPDSAPADHANP